MLLDSNILIYAIQPQHLFLIDLIAAHQAAVCEVSYVEVLGFPQLSAEDARDFEDLFLRLRRLPVDWRVIRRAAQLRRERRSTLITRNTADFRYVAGLRLFDPFAVTPP